MKKNLFRRMGMMAAFALLGTAAMAVLQGNSCIGASYKL